MQRGMKQGMRQLIRHVRLLSLFTTFLLMFCAKTFGSEGTVTFDNLQPNYGSPKVNLNLNKDLILMAALISGNNDPELVEILNKLEAVKIRVYNTQGNINHALKSIESQTAQLSEANWHTVINRDEEEKLTRIFTHSNNQLIEGVVVMKLEKTPSEGELAFINIVGEIDPSQVQKVAQSLNLNMGI